jgi:hypothetical protein
MNDAEMISSEIIFCRDDFAELNRNRRTPTNYVIFISYQWKKILEYQFT